MKSKWEKILRQWRVGNPTGTIPKEESPALLKELVDHNHRQNMVKGFSACGIVPLDKEHVLKKIPTIQRLVSGYKIDINSGYY